MAEEADSEDRRRRRRGRWRRRRWWESQLAGTFLGGLIGFTTAWYTNERQNAAQIRAAERQFEALKYQVQFPEKSRLYGEVLAALEEQREFVEAINERRKDGSRQGTLGDYERLLAMQKRTYAIGRQLEPFIERKDVRYWLYGWAFVEGQQAFRYALQQNTHRTYWEGVRALQQFREWVGKFQACLLESLFVPPKEGDVPACPTPGPTVTPTAALSQRAVPTATARP